MANPVTPILIDSETLAQFLAKSVSDGTYSDVIETVKTDEAGKEAAASQIAVAAGQLWSNLGDDLFKITYERLHKVEKVWRAADAAARDGLGSDNGLQVGDLAFVLSPPNLFHCTNVLGPSSSLWSALSGGGGPVPVVNTFADNTTQDLPVGDVTTDTMVLVQVSLWNSTTGEATSYRYTITANAAAINSDLLSTDSPSPITTVAVSTILVGNVITIRLTGSGPGNTIKSTHQILATFAK